MNNRLPTGAVAALVVLIALAIGIFGYTYFFKSQPAVDGVATTTDTVPAEEMTIQALHQYASSTHTVAGQANVPTPCHRLIVEPSFVNGSTSEVVLRFSATTTDDVCAQVITPARFKTSFEGPENATITATWNGAPAKLNLIPVQEGESLDNFEEYFKG